MPCTVVIKKSSSCRVTKRNGINLLIFINLSRRAHHLSIYNLESRYLSVSYSDRRINIGLAANGQSSRDVIDKTPGTGK